MGGERRNGVGPLLQGATAEKPSLGPPGRIQKADPPEASIVYTMGVLEFRIDGSIFGSSPGCGQSRGTKLEAESLAGARAREIRNIGTSRKTLAGLLGGLSVLMPLEKEPDRSAWRPLKTSSFWPPAYLGSVCFLSHRSKKTRLPRYYC